MTPRGRTRPLTRRYALGIAAIALPLLLLAGGLAATQFAAERTARLELIARDLSDLRDELEAIVRPAADHVRQLRQLAEDHLAGRVPTPASPLRALLRSERLEIGGEASSALLLDRMAGTPSQDLVGNFRGRAELAVERMSA